MHANNTTWTVRRGASGVCSGVCIGAPQLSEVETLRPDLLRSVMSYPGLFSPKRHTSLTYVAQCSAT